METSYNSDGYIEFRIVEDLIVKAGRRLKLRFTVGNQEGSPFDQANDASYFPTRTGRVSSDRIHVWLDGERIWGRETR